MDLYSIGCCRLNSDKAQKIATILLRSAHPLKYLNLGTRLQCNCAGRVQQDRLTGTPRDLRSLRAPLARALPRWLTRIYLITWSRREQMEPVLPGFGVRFVHAPALWPRGSLAPRLRTRLAVCEGNLRRLRGQHAIHA